MGQFLAFSPFLSFSFSLSKEDDDPFRGFFPASCLCPNPPNLQVCFHTHPKPKPRGWHHHMSLCKSETRETEWEDRCDDRGNRWSIVRAEVNDERRGSMSQEMEAVSTTGKGRPWLPPRCQKKKKKAAFPKLWVLNFQPPGQQDHMFAAL